MSSQDQHALPEQEPQLQTADADSNPLMFFARIALSIAPPSYWARSGCTVPNFDGVDEHEHKHEVEGNGMDIDTKVDATSSIDHEVYAGTEFKTADKDDDMSIDDHNLTVDEYALMIGELVSPSSSESFRSLTGEVILSCRDEDEWSSVSSRGKSVSQRAVKCRSHTKSSDRRSVSSRGKSVPRGAVKCRSHTIFRDRRGRGAARSRRARARFQHKHRKCRREETKGETIYRIYEDYENGEEDQDKVNSNNQVKAMGIETAMEEFFVCLGGFDSLWDSVGHGPGENIGRRRRIHLQNNITPLIVRTKRTKRDFFGALSQYTELLLEATKYLRCKDLLSLYSISKDFHETINGHMTYVLKHNALYHAPESSRIFLFTFYDQLCMIDPVGEPHPVIPNQIRKVPSIKWLQMVVHRERAVRDILACMAREGHRMPKSMSPTLKKIWLTMDISTSAGRVKFMHNEEFWTDLDLFNVMMFIVKLDMRCNDPIYGPGDDGLRKLFLGQRGLTPLRNLLKRKACNNVLEIIELAVRYEYTMMPEHMLRRLSIFGVPWHEVGRGHLEGWGAGRVHLYRVDEVMLMESARRGLQLGDYLEDMLLWGYVDPLTKQNIKVTDEEMYMSDDEDECENKSEVENRRKVRDGWEDIDALYENNDNDDGDQGDQGDEGDEDNFNYDTRKEYIGVDYGANKDDYDGIEDRANEDENGVDYGANEDEDGVDGVKYGVLEDNYERVDGDIDCGDNYDGADYEANEVNYGVDGVNYGDNGDNNDEFIDIGTDEDNNDGVSDRVDYGNNGDNNDGFDGFIDYRIDEDSNDGLDGFIDYGAYEDDYNRANDRVDHRANEDNYGVDNRVDDGDVGIANEWETEDEDEDDLRA